MAIQATTAQCEVGWRRTTGQIVRSAPDAGMSKPGMTLLAQNRSAPGQHGRIVRAMWLVAMRAILGNRSMLPQEWAAGLGMATSAVLVDSQFAEHGFAAGAMRLMTVRAGHFSMAYGMGVCPMGLGARLHMAIGADPRLTGRDRHRIATRVRCVTVDATDLVLLMGATVPEAMARGLVAGQAGFIFLLIGPERIRAECRYWRTFGANPDGSGMVIAGTMAGFALGPSKR